MENLVVNYLTILGSSSEVKKAMDVVLGEENELSFGNFYPVPSDLLLAEIMPITQSDLSKLDQRHGLLSAQQWREANWTAVVDAMDTSIETPNKVKFYTYDLSPYGAMQRLSLMFPKLKFRVDYADEDNLGFDVGCYLLKNGEIVEVYEPKGGSEEAYDLAITLTGDDFYIGEFLMTLSETECVEEFPAICLNLAYKRKNLMEGWPLYILEFMEAKAVYDEEYEYANEVKNMIDNIKIG